MRNMPDNFWIRRCNIDEKSPTDRPNIDLEAAHHPVRLRERPLLLPPTRLRPLLLRPQEKGQANP